MVTDRTLQNRLEVFRKTCQERGIKLTHQRLEIFRVLAGRDDHPDVETIYRIVKERIPTISLDTVYRNLRFLAEEGLISVVGLTDERQRFDANMSRHHHFVCILCGAIRDFTAETCGDVEVPDEVRRLGKPISVHLEVKGVCRKCQGSR